MTKFTREEYEMKLALRTQTGLGKQLTENDMALESCPTCGTADTTWDHDMDWDVETPSGWYHGQCNVCDTMWKDKYELTARRVLVITETQGDA